MDWIDDGGGLEGMEGGAKERYRGRWEKSDGLGMHNLRGIRLGC